MTLTDRLSQLDHDVEVVSLCHRRLRLGNERVVPDRQGERENGCICDSQHVLTYKKGVKDILFSPVVYWIVIPAGEFALLQSAPHESSLTLRYSHII